MRIMRKILDIQKKITQEDIDISSQMNREIQIDPLGSQNSENIGNASLPDIHLSSQKDIIVQTKNTKNFDALEKRSHIFWALKKNISLKKREKNMLDSASILLSKQRKKLKKLSIFSIFAWIFIFSIFSAFLSKIIIENRVNAWYEKLLLIRQGNMSFEEIRKNINNARFDFFLSDVLFAPFSLLPDEKIYSVKHVIAWGRDVSKGLDEISSLYNKIYNYSSQKKLSNIYFSQLFLNIYNDVAEIRDILYAWKSHYEKISWLPNDTLWAQKDAGIQAITELGGYMDVFLQDFKAFSWMLGHEERRRYLIVFQNADEIRPTWGFMGSMALVEMFKGQIKLFQKKDVYAIEWDLKSAQYERLPAPKWLNELTSTFWLRDANYFVNIQDSSETIKFFTDRAGVNIDGVIYINQNILLKLLDVTGPIYFEEIGREISSENFSEIMSLLVEAKVSKEGTLGTPKQILFDFIEIFLTKISQEKRYFDYLKVLIHEAKSRDMMMWSFREQENIFLQNIWLTGDVEYENSLDFIYPVYTSLSGNKSDRYMRHSYTHRVEYVSGSCDFRVESTIKSSHNMTQNAKERIQNMLEEYNIQQDDIMQIQGNMRNRQYVRVILPKNADILAQQNMEIIDYGARQWAEFFITTQPQESTFYTLSYILQNPDCKNYDFTLYKQPWIPSFDVNLDILWETFEYRDRQEDFYFEKR